MKTGFAKLCITPPLETPIVGYYHERLAEGVLDDLYVRATAFDDGEKRSVIITLDLCILPKDYYTDLRELVAKTCNLEPDAVLINLSHTHTGPLIGADFASGKNYGNEYQNLLTLLIRDAAAYAFKDLKESTFYVAYNKAEGVSFVRRYRMKDGSVQTNPGPKNPDIDHVLAEADSTVRVLKIKREGGKDICLVNFATHPDSVGGNFISADWPGTVCATVEKAFEDVNCVFLLGPQGDTNHINPHPTKGEEATYFIDFDNVPRSKTHSELRGHQVAGAVISVYDLAEEITADKIGYSSKMVTIPSHKENDRLEEATKIQELYKAGRANELPYKGMELTTVLAESKRIVRLANGPDSFTFRFSCMNIGEFAIAGFAGEPFTEIGKRVFAEAPFEHTFLCCLTDSGAYFPTTKAFSEGGYEARGSSIAPGADDIIVENMCEMLKGLKK